MFAWLKRDRFSVLLALVLLSSVSAPAQDASGAKRLVFAHYCPWVSVENQEHGSRRDFPLAMGFTERADGYRLQIEWARQAGIDGFMVDCLNDVPGKRFSIRTFRRIQEVAEETAPDFLVFPCLDRIGSLGADGLLDFMLDALQSTDSPAWFRLDGKPVFWTYDAGSFPVGEWPGVLQRLRAAGHDVVVVCDLGAWLRRNRVNQVAEAEVLPLEADIIRWGQIGPVYPFDGELEPTMKRIRSVLRAHECTGSTPTIGTLRPGYFAVKNGHWLPDLFTRRLREQFPHVSGLDMLNITTWNDYGEDTHFEPSRNKLYCRLDVLRALTAQYKGHAWPSSASQARWYLSAPWLCDPGDSVEAEILGLVPGAWPDTKATIAMVADGAVLAERDGVLSGGRIRAYQVAFELAPASAPRSVRLRATVEVEGQDCVTWHSAPIVAWPYSYHPSPTRCNIATSPSRTLTDGPALDLTLAAGVVQRVTATWPPGPPGCRVHINQNGRLRRVTGTARDDCCRVGPARYGTRVRRT